MERASAWIDFILYSSHCCQKQKQTESTTKQSFIYRHNKLSQHEIPAIPISPSQPKTEMNFFYLDIYKTKIAGILCLTLNKSAKNKCWIHVSVVWCDKNKRNDSLLNLLKEATGWFPWQHTNCSLYIFQLCCSPFYFSFSSINNLFEMEW